MPVDCLSANLDTHNDNYVTNTECVNTANQICNNTGIETVEKVGLAIKSGIFVEKAELAAPDKNYMDYMEEAKEVTPEMGKILNVKAKVMTRAELCKTCLEKLVNGQNAQNNSSNSEFNLEEMNGEDLEMLCLLLCQTIKSKLVDTLKETLNTKVKSREGLNKKYTEKQLEMAKEQIKFALELAEAKKLATARAVVTAVFAVVAAVIAVAVAIASGGAALPLFILAISGAVCAVGGAGCSIAGSVLTIETINSDNEKEIERLNEANKIVGYVGLAFSLAGCVCSVTSGIAALKGFSVAIPKVIQAISGATQATESAVNAGFSFAEADATKRQAELEEEMADIDIEKEKLDKKIQAINQFIDLINDILPLLIKNILEAEQKCSSEFANHTDSQSSIAAKVGV